MNDPSTQQTDWEAILESEGMPAELTGGCPLFVDPVRAMATIPNQPDSSLPFTGGSDYDEVCRLHTLLDWLPPYDGHLLDRVCAGQTHEAIGRSLGISQPSTTRQVQRAIVRLQGLDDIDGLGHPDDLLPASLFVRLVRRLPSFRRPAHDTGWGEDTGAPHVQQNRASNDGNRRQNAENREPSESGVRTVKM